MIWKTVPPKRGDIIRVKMSFYFHYGIYVDDDTVIQFGLPDNTGVSPENIAVCSTDVYTFSCGNLCEAGIMDKRERKNAFSPEKIVSRAKERIGETGYNMTENNCEHFVNTCVFGEHTVFGEK